MAQDEIAESVVAVIKIGEVFSGISYSRKKEYDEDPFKIRTFEESINGQYRSYNEIPTTMILDANKNFKYFGFEADDKITEEPEVGHYVFRHFLLPVSITIGDGHVCSIDNRIAVPVERLLEYQINFLKSIVEKRIKMALMVDSEDIKWVVIYPDDFKPLVSKAIQKSKLSIRNPMLVCESGAHLQFSKFVYQGRNFLVYNCSVVNTCSNAVYEVGDSLKDKAIDLSLNHSSQICLGQKFLQNVDEILLEKIGCKCFGNLPNDDITDTYTQLDKILQQNLSPKVTIKLSSEAFDLLTRKNFKDHNEFIAFRNQKIRVSKYICKNAFRKSVLPQQDKLAKHLESFGRSGPMNIILVGDLCKYQIIYDIFQEKFPNLTFLRHQHCHLSDILGAIMIAHSLEMPRPRVQLVLPKCTSNIQHLKFDVPMNKISVEYQSNKECTDRNLAVSNMRSNSQSHKKRSSSRGEEINLRKPLLSTIEEHREHTPVSKATNDVDIQCSLQNQNTIDIESTINELFQSADNRWIRHQHY